MTPFEINSLKKYSQAYRLKLLHAQANSQLRDIARQFGISPEGSREDLIHKIDCHISWMIGYDKIAGKDVRI